MVDEAAVAPDPHVRQGGSRQQPFTSGSEAPSISCSSSWSLENLAAG